MKNPVTEAEKAVQGMQHQRGHNQKMMNYVEISSSQANKLNKKKKRENKRY